jgi:hypothetical protein
MSSTLSYLLDCVCRGRTGPAAHATRANAKGKTLVRARFASENRTKADLGKTTLRMLAAVKEHGPATQRRLARLGKIVNVAGGHARQGHRCAGRR